MNKTEGFFIYHSHTWKPFSFLFEPIYFSKVRTLFYFFYLYVVFFFFFFFYEKLREVVSCCKGEWKAIQEKSLSKSENEGFVIQKIQSPKSVFRTTIFFFLTPHFTLTFTFITRTCHFFFFNTNINFIYFYFNYNTLEKRAR